MAAFFCVLLRAIVILTAEFWVLRWLLHGTGLAALFADRLWGEAHIACVVQVRRVGVGMAFIVAGDGVYVVGLNCFAESFAVFQTLLFYWNCHRLFPFERDARLFYLVAGGCGRCVNGFIAEIACAVIIVEATVGILSALRRPRVGFLLKAPALLVRVLAGESSRVLTKAARFD